MSPDERTWPAVHSALSGGSVRRRSEANAVHREEHFVAERRKWFVRVDRHPDIPRLLDAWFAKLVGDADLVSARAEVDLSSISPVVSHAGRPTAQSLLFKKERKTKQLVDVGLVRYPDPKQPYVKVYRIELSAWYESTILLGCTFDKNGVRATFDLLEMEPLEMTVCPQKPTDMRLALAEADALFA
ncbi:hypothetical protein AURDEDRAFT_164299 [Auricularia subglabra TFB-10046 SS5]|nr:hypothetical protein AURDEDRAFT_164299 [Auricularia subglabra TFB-10046 SS5]